MARYPTMLSADGRWSVEIMTVRGTQSFRVKRLDAVLPAGAGWTPSGRLCTSIEQVRELLGPDVFATLAENRSKRFEGGRRQPGQG